ncbi:MAG: DUF5106 domain-containing protein [Tannerella sp.]|jgi:hypothetical protein|nr:DUF5106 domain-containing protein [Tannerella sp.]
MKVDLRLLAALVVALTVGGCTSGAKKNAETAETAAPAIAPKNIERTIPPAVITNPTERANFIVTHFWDKFDFRDTTYCNTPVMDQAFVDYLAAFPYTAPDKREQGVKLLLDKAEMDVVMYNYCFRMAEKYLYEPNSPMRNDEFFIPFLDHVVNSKRLDDVHKIRPRHLLELAYRNRIGTKALDFTYIIASGAKKRLYSLASPYLLLMFYNPECPECHRTIEMLKSSPVVTDAIASGKLKVLLVYPDENLDAWKKHLSEIPSTWINGYDTITIKENELYDLKAIPTLYLLDKNKTVIFKDTSTGDIHDFLSKE